MSGHKRPAESQNIEEYVHYVKDMIERCTQRYMCQQEAEQYLETHFQIQPDITGIIWKQLEEENKDFFRWYREIYLVRKQIIQLNELLERQAAMLQQMQAAQKEHPQSDFNSAPGGNAQVVMTAPQAPEVPLQPNLFVSPTNNQTATILEPNQLPEVPLQLDLNVTPPPSEPDLLPLFPLHPDLSTAHRNNQPATVPVANQRPGVSLLPGLNVAPRDNMAVTVPVSGSPNLQPGLSIGTHYNQAAMFPYPCAHNQQHQSPSQPAFSLPGNNSTAGTSATEIFSSSSGRPLYISLTASLTL